MRIDLDLERWPGSPVIHLVGRNYARWAAARFADAPARLTPRQGIIYRNLIRIAEEIRSGDIPVDFHVPSGERLYLDRGCIRIAALAGFIRPLADDAGVVSMIRLAWTV